LFDFALPWRCSNYRIVRKKKILPTYLGYTREYYQEQPNKATLRKKRESIGEQLSQERGNKLHLAKTLTKKAGGSQKKAQFGELVFR
jgi:hypothetical protein